MQAHRFQPGTGALSLGFDVFVSTGSYCGTLRYLVQNRPLPDHMTSPFLPHMLDPTAHDVASRLRQNFGGGTQTALMFPSGRHGRRSS